jgi:hypothetical protein
MDKESIRLILANISQLAAVPQLSNEEIEGAITKLDALVIRDKGQGFSIEGPGYPLSELPYYLHESGAVEKIFSFEMMLTNFTKFARPVTDGELNAAFGNIKK